MNRPSRFASRLPLLLGFVLFSGFTAGAALAQPAAAARTSVVRPPPVTDTAELDRLRAALSDSELAATGAEDKVGAFKAELALKDLQLQNLAAENAGLRHRLDEAEKRSAPATAKSAADLALIGSARLVEDRVAIAGAELHLAGVVIDRPRAERAETIVESVEREGNSLRCVPVAAGWSCRNTATGRDDLASVLASNGVATSTDDAGDEIRRAEAEARAHHRGVWSSAR